MAATPCMSLKDRIRAIFGRKRRTRSMSAFVGTNQHTYFKEVEQQQSATDVNVLNIRPARATNRSVMFPTSSDFTPSTSIAVIEQDHGKKKSNIPDIASTYSCNFSLCSWTSKRSLLQQKSPCTSVVPHNLNHLSENKLPLIEFEHESDSQENINETIVPHRILKSDETCTFRVISAPINQTDTQVVFNRRATLLPEKDCINEPKLAQHENEIMADEISRRIIADACSCNLQTNDGTCTNPHVNYEHSEVSCALQNSEYQVKDKCIQVNINTKTEGVSCENCAHIIQKDFLNEVLVSGGKDTAKDVDTLKRHASDDNSQLGIDTKVEAVSFSESPALVDIGRGTVFTKVKADTTGGRSQNDKENMNGDTTDGKLSENKNIDFENVDIKLYYSQNNDGEISDLTYFDDKNADITPNMTYFDGENDDITPNMTYFDGENDDITPNMTYFDGENDDIVTTDMTYVDGENADIVTPNMTYFDGENADIVTPNMTYFDGENTDIVTPNMTYVDGENADFVTPNMTYFDGNNSDIVTPNMTYFDSNNADIVTPNMTYFDDNSADIVTPNMMYLDVEYLSVQTPDTTCNDNKQINDNTPRVHCDNIKNCNDETRGIMYKDIQINDETTIVTYNESKQIKIDTSDETFSDVQNSIVETTDATYNESNQINIETSDVTYNDSKNINVETSNVTYNDSKNINVETSDVTYNDSKNINVETSDATYNESKNINVETSDVTYNDSKNINVETTDVTYNESKNINVETSDVTYNDSKNINVETTDVTYNESKNINVETSNVTYNESKNIDVETSDVTYNDSKNINVETSDVTYNDSKNINVETTDVTYNESKNINVETSNVTYNESKNIDVETSDVTYNDSKNINVETTDVTYNESKNINVETSAVTYNDSKNINVETTDVTYNERKKCNDETPNVTYKDSNINDETPDVSCDDSKQINDETQGITKKDSNINDETQGIANQDSNINDETQGITNQDSNINDATQGITNQDSNINDETQGITKKDSNINDETQGITNQDSNINDETQGITNQDSNINDETQGITNQDSNINDETQGITNQDSNINDETQGITKKDSNINDETQGITNQDSNINDETQGITNQDSNINDETQGITNQDSNINDETPNVTYKDSKRTSINITHVIRHYNQPMNSKTSDDRACYCCNVTSLSNKQEASNTSRRYEYASQCHNKLKNDTLIYQDPDESNTSNEQKEIIDETAKNTTKPSSSLSAANNTTKKPEEMNHASKSNKKQEHPSNEKALKEKRCYEKPNTARIIRWRIDNEPAISENMAPLEHERTETAQCESVRSDHKNTAGDEYSVVDYVSEYIPGVTNGEKEEPCEGYKLSVQTSEDISVFAELDGKDPQLEWAISDEDYRCRFAEGLCRLQQEHQNEHEIVVANYNLENMQNAENESKEAEIINKENNCEIIPASVTLEDYQDNRSLVDECGLVDVYHLSQNIHSSIDNLNQRLSECKSHPMTIDRLQLYLEQVTKEKNESKRQLRDLSKQAVALRHEALELRSVLTDVCDSTGENSEAKILEPVCYKKYSNIRKPSDATKALSHVRNHLKALTDLEVLIYRKQLVLLQVFPNGNHEQTPPPKRTNRPTHKMSKSKRNEQAVSSNASSMGNVVIEIVPSVPDPNNWSKDMSHTDSPLTISTLLSISNEATASTLLLTDTEV